VDQINLLGVKIKAPGFLHLPKYWFYVRKGMH